MNKLLVVVGILIAGIGVVLMLGVPLGGYRETLCTGGAARRSIFR